MKYRIDPPKGIPTPFGKGVVVDVSHADDKPPKEKKTESGIIYALNNDKTEDGQRERLVYDGYVVAVGPDCTRVKVGAHVVLPIGTGAMVQYRWHTQPADRKFARVIEDNLLGIFENEKPTKKVKEK